MTQLLKLTPSSLLPKVNGQKLHQLLKEQWLEEGDAYLSAKRYREAIVTYDRVLEVDSENILACHNRGRSHYALKEYQEAIADFDRVLEANSRSPLAYTERGQTYKQLKVYEKAIEDFNRALV